MSVRRVSVGHKLPYNILDKLHAVSSGVRPLSTSFTSSSLSLSLFLCLSCSHLLLQLVSEILRFHKTSLLAACFFSCHRMSSFLLFLRLSTAFKFDETFPVVSHASLSFFPFLSIFLFFSTPFSFFRFLFIYIVGVTRAIQRNLVSPHRDFFQALQLAIVDPATLLNPAKTLSCFLPFYNITFPEADIIPRNISLLVFTVRPFSASRLPSPYIKNNSFSNLFVLARIKFRTISPRTHGGTPDTKSNNF